MNTFFGLLLISAPFVAIFLLFWRMTGNFWESLIVYSIICFIVALIVLSIMGGVCLLSLSIPSFICAP